MKKSFIALTLTLLLLVSLFTVPAFAEKAPGCVHTTCSEPECTLICGITEHLHTDDCLAFDDEGNQVFIEREICGKIYHVHSEVGGTCYTLICADTAATHTHNDDCWELSCEKEEHEHIGTCYEYDPAYICQMEEHVHDNSCYRCNHICAAACGVYEYYPEYAADEDAPAAPAVDDDAVAPQTGEVISVTALVALMAAAAACVVFSARKVRG